MKRILLPATGALLATGLLAAGLATSAQAEAEVKFVNLTDSGKVESTVNFWLAAEGAALIAAEEYRYDYKAVSKLVHTGGYTTDTKPGLIGEPKTKVTKVHNVNIPRTIGKVFFTKNGGKDLYWCSATSIQSSYKNLVATAGHCVYDVAGNEDTLENWVFVPGSYQGKAYYGIYVGKTAYTHSDFSVYEDYDRDYAFVTVYNGLKVARGEWKQVTWTEYKNYSGTAFKKDDVVEISKETYEANKNNPDRTVWVEAGTADTDAGPDNPKAVFKPYEVSYWKYKDAPSGRGDHYKFGEPVTENVTKAQYDAYTGPGYKKIDAAGNYTITRYYLQDWYVPGTAAKYLERIYLIGADLTVTDAGRLQDNVGAQGFAWNQPAGKYVRTFGYPGAEHPDGSKPFSGRTPKWCYGKTSAKTPAGTSTYKAEELLALKCAVTAGYNGSAWLFQYSNAKRVGYVNGVTTAIYGDADGNKRIDTIFSPYFDGETKQVYDAAAKNWSGTP